MYEQGGKFGIPIKNTPRAKSSAKSIPSIKRPLILYVVVNIKLCEIYLILIFHLVNIYKKNFIYSYINTTTYKLQKELPRFLGQQRFCSLKIIRLYCYS